LGAVAKAAALLAVAVVLSLVLGYYIGSGYTMEVRYFTAPMPARLAIKNFTSPVEYPVMLVSGLAYEKVSVNLTEPARFPKPPISEGNITCHLKAGLGYYECTGSGYIYMPVGRKLEVLKDYEVSRYYYSGAPLGPHGTYIILYSYKFSQFILAFAVPIANISIALALLKYTYGRLPKDLFMLTYIMSAVLSAAMIYIGGINGLYIVPEELAPLEEYISKVVLVASCVTTGIYGITYLLYLKLGRRK